MAPSVEAELLRTADVVAEIASADLIVADDGHDTLERDVEEVGHFRRRCM